MFIIAELGNKLKLFHLENEENDPYLQRLLSRWEIIVYKELSTQSGIARQITLIITVVNNYFSRKGAIEEFVG